jgi:predicted transcriptional regulator
VVKDVRHAKLTRPELQLMEVLWTRGACSVREIHEALPPKGRAAFTTIQTMIYRLEAKQAVRCVKRIGKANIFEAAVSRDEAHGRLLDEFLAIFGGRTRMVMSHLIGSGRLTLADIKEAEQELRALSRKDRKP